MPGILHAANSRTAVWLLYLVLFDYFFFKLGLSPSTKNVFIFYCLSWLQFWIRQAAAGFSDSDWWKCWAPPSQTTCLLLFCFCYCRAFLWLSSLHSSCLHSLMMHFLYFSWELRFNIVIYCHFVFKSPFDYRFFIIDFSTFIQNTTTASIENTLMYSSSWTRGSSTQPGPTKWKS